MTGFLVAVFVYGGWDGTLYVNEETKQRRVNRAAPPPCWLSSTRCRRSASRA